MEIKIQPNIDLEAQEITFSCASGKPCLRTVNGDTFYERLVISEEAIDFSRLDCDASILKNHDSDIVLGNVVKAWVDGDVLAVRARFKKNDPDAVNIFRDIADGTSRNVSIGYQWIDFVPTEENGEKFRDITRWLPLEVSVDVGVPADETVGMFRSLNYTTNPKEGTQRMSEEENAPAESPAPETPAPAEEKKDPCEQCKFNPDCKTPEGEREEPCKCCRFAEAPEEETEEKPEQAEETAPAEEQAPAEPEPAQDEVPEEKPEEKPEEDEQRKQYVQQVREICDLTGSTKADDFIARNLPFEEVCRELKSSIIIKSLNQPKGNKSMSKPYSIARAIQSLVNPKIDASTERAYSESVYRSLGLTPTPGAIMVNFQRDNEFTGAANANGNSLIGTDHLGDKFIDGLRGRIGVKGFQVLPFTGRGNVEIPVQTGFSTVGIGAINSTVSKTYPTTSKLTFTPKKFGARVDVTEDLLYLGSPEAINLVVQDLEKQIARKLGYAILHGDADASIAGIDGTTGVQTIELSSLANLTYAKMLEFGGKIADYELDETASWVTKGSSKQLFKGISKDTGSGRFLCEDDLMDGMEVNVDATCTANDLYLGVWSNVYVGDWSGVEIKIDDITGLDSGVVKIVMKKLLDVQVANPAAFVKRTAPVATT